MSTKFLQVFAKKDKRATYTVEIHGQGYTAALLRTLFAALEQEVKAKLAARSRRSSKAPARGKPTRSRRRS